MIIKIIALIFAIIISAGETIISYGQVNVSPFGRTVIVFAA